MTATTRQFISALLSLLLVISGPALAMSKIADSDADTAMPDCGELLSNLVYDHQAAFLSD